MNIAIVGTGGVGGFFGGKLTQLLETHKDLKIYFIARNQHLEQIKKNGLILVTDEGEFLCKPSYSTDHINELPVLDFVLICVKSYDLDNVITQLKTKIRPDTVILPLLNGVDIYQRIKAVIPDAIIYPSCVYVGTHIEKPGKVTQRGGACTIHFGNDPGHNGDHGWILNLMDAANIRMNYTDNPYTEIWSKFIFIASFGLISANYNKTLGEILDTAELKQEVNAIMREIKNLAKKQDIMLPESIIEDSFNKANIFPYETKTSFQRDFELMDKKDERDLFSGTIIRMGKEFNVDTSITTRIGSSIQKMKPVNW